MLAGPTRIRMVVKKIEAAWTLDEFLKESCVGYRYSTWLWGPSESILLAVFATGTRFGKVNIPDTRGGFPIVSCSDTR